MHDSHDSHGSLACSLSRPAKIKKYIAQSEICNQCSAKKPKETLMSHEATDRRWEKIAADIYNIDCKDYPITVDYFSNFWEIDSLRDTKASTSVKCPQVSIHKCPFCKKWHSRCCNLRPWTTVYLIRICIVQ